MDVEILITFFHLGFLLLLLGVSDLPQHHFPP